MSEKDKPNEMHVELNALIEMRDGAKLATSIFKPKGDRKFPTVLIRHTHGPADKINPELTNFYVRNSYAFVVESPRGFHQSEGSWDFFKHDGWGENRDGYDTIEWIASQPWSDGNIGMMGGSGSAVPQYLVSPTPPPNLKALFITVGWTPRNLVYRGGAYRMCSHRGILTLVAAMMLNIANQEDVKTRLERANNEIDRWYRHLPLEDYPPFAELLDWYFEHLRHPDYGDYWSGMDALLRADETDVPAVHLTGWFDFDLETSIRAFKALQRYGKTERCRSGQRLIIGPWSHGFPDLDPGEKCYRQLGDVDFGADAAFDMHAYRLKWYDHWLKGKNNGKAGEKPVQVFLMGENRWLELDEWPPANIEYRAMYLREGKRGADATLNGGVLSSQQPGSSEKADDYRYDLEDPIPTLGEYPGVAYAPVDQRPIESRILCYTSEALKEPSRIIGPVTTVIYASSSAPDTDWVVRLCDVWPDGRSIPICNGVLRARYRESQSYQLPMSPGSVYRFEIDMFATAITFLPGHLIRVHVTSSDFPRYDRNLNTGGHFAEESIGQIAENVIYHDAERASHVTLPVVSD